MLENPFQTPVQTHLDRMVEMRLSYAVNRDSNNETARLFAVSRMEIYGAMGGLAVTAIIAVCAFFAVTPSTGFMVPLPWSIGIAIVFATAAGLLFRNKRTRALAKIRNSILHQSGVRTVTITADRLTVNINGDNAEWPMDQVRYLDRKRGKTGRCKQTLLQLSANLPLAIPDNCVFENVERDRFLRLLKQRCRNVCVF